MPHCLVIVPVPEVEPHVSRLRDLYDPAARRGLGAHITLLHTPRPVGGTDPALLAALGKLGATASAFAYTIARTGRFPSTLFLAAEPAGPFQWLNEQLLQVSSDSGARSFVPHISVVRGRAMRERAHEVEQELTLMLARQGPIHCVCSGIKLLEDSTGVWRSVRRFALTGGTDSPSPAPS
jgi:2'-5' RNA ligase